MKITVEDAGMVNWDNVAERMSEEVQQELQGVLRNAQAVLGDLKPGQRRTLSVKVGSITVARPK